MLTRDNYTTTSEHPGVVVGEVNRNRVPGLGYLEKKELVVIAEGLDYLLDFVQKEMPEPQRDRSSSNHGSSGFNAFVSYEEAMHIFRDKPQSIVKYDENNLTINDHFETGNLVEYEVVGDYIDMGRYIEGVPETWGTMHGGKSRTRRANVLVDLSQAAYMEQATINKRSERIVRLVDSLETGGVRTQLTCVGSTQTCHVETTIKHYTESLVLSDLAVVNHSEFLRRILFRIIEHSKTYSSTYGRAGMFENAIGDAPDILDSDSNDEFTIFIAGGLSASSVNNLFDKLELLLEWELSKSVPEIKAISLTDRGIYFETTSARAEADIKREGNEILASYNHR